MPVQDKQLPLRAALQRLFEQAAQAVGEWRTGRYENRCGRQRRRPQSGMDGWRL